MSADLRLESAAPKESITEGRKVAQISTLKAGMYACARCPNTWTGLLTSHCGACHRTFTGLTAFDAHRDGSHPRDTRRCLDPVEVGLVRANRDYPCWGFPSDGSEWWKAKR